MNHITLGQFYFSLAHGYSVHYNMGGLTPSMMDGKKLVNYYQITNTLEERPNIELVSFNITFDKDKIHDLFFTRGVSYSEILDKELCISPIPSLAMHCTNVNSIFGLSPNMNWSNLWDENEN